MSKAQHIQDIEIWCTLGPSSLNERMIKRLQDIGISMFRINLSHTKARDIEKIIREVKKHTCVSVCLDTEGPQVRNGVMKNGKAFLKEGSTVYIRKKEILGDSCNLNLRPANILPSLKLADLISIDFDAALLSVKRISKDYIATTVLSEGWVGSNKAVTIDRKIELPILSKKDMKGIEITKRYGLGAISLSFVNKKEDVEFVRKLLGRNVRIVSKIETSQALKNLDEIIAVSDAILIDRGDLSREEPINKIPLLQKSIIEAANKQRKPVFVATNLLESMVVQKKPLRSEVNDVMNTLLDGADGLVLAAETAIGKHPAECANMVKRIIKYYQIALKEYSLPQLLRNDSFLLVEPHGGELIDRYNEKIDTKTINQLPRLKVDERAVIDAEQIALGTYSPLKGFMTKEELHSVLDNYKLPNGIVWTLPITLQVPKPLAKEFKKNEDIALMCDDTVYAIMHIRDIFTVDFHKVCKKWYGTLDKNHPGVHRLFENGNYLLGGEITLVKKRDSEYKEFEFTPHQTRLIFEHKEWSKICGFHTRNAIHRAHEYLQMRTLEKYDLDGLFLHPIIGPKKPHDFKPHIILESYQIMLKFFYPKAKVVLAAFCAYSHYAGPREAVFTAICRKNFGCSHFIVGRDHTGLRDYYQSDATRRLFDKLGDIGITPIFFDTVYYCKKCRQYIDKCEHSAKDFLHISGTEARKMLLSGRRPPEWFFRKEISSLILKKVKNGEEVFVK
jgi:pyruvate kinase